MNIDTAKCYEARDWLAQNRSVSAFATNRFGPTEKARAFVEELYSAGATKVLIPYRAVRAQKEEVSRMGGPYADTLIIELPASGREQLYAIFEREAADEGYDEMLGADSVIDGRFLHLWWD